MNLGALGFAWIVIAGVLTALVLMAIGIFRAMRAAIVLRKRLAVYADLPILGAIDRTQFRVNAAMQRMKDVDALLDRARVALEQIRTQLMVLRSVFVPSAKGSRIPGN